MANGGAFDMFAAGNFDDPGIQAVTVSVGGQDLLTRSVPATGTAD